MKKTISALLVLCLACMLSAPAFAATMTMYSTADKNSAGFSEFAARHPELSYEWSEEYCSNTSELAGRLMTRELRADLLGFWTNIIDTSRLIDKGYLLDLSGNADIEALTERLVPVAADAVTRDGAIYAVPQALLFDYWAADEAAWDAAGLSMSEVPESYPEFLDFLDAWCDRIEDEPEYNIRVVNYWDATVYDESSYIQLLTDMLLQNTLLQQRYSGSAVAFETDEIIGLLERAAVIGKRLYEAEPAIQKSDTSFGLGLFYSISRPSWPENSADIVSLRLNEQQPKLIAVTMIMSAVSSATELPNESIELIGTLAQRMTGEQLVYLLKDAQPVENSRYESNAADNAKYISDIEEKLKDDGLDNEQRSELESDLAAYLRMRDILQSDANRYIVSPAQVADYRAHTDMLCIIPTDVFSPGTDSYTQVVDLEKRFAHGIISSQELLYEMDRLARMIQMEEID